MGERHKKTNKVKFCQAVHLKEEVQKLKVDNLYLIGY